MGKEKVLSPTLKPKRDAWLDNIKAILMILVVVGHAIANIKDDFTDMLWLYNGINFFHMGTFFIISGYLSRRRVAQRDWISLINGSVVPYITAQIRLFITGAVIQNGFKALGATSYVSGSEFSFFTPIYQLWYLVAMIMFIIIAMVGQPKKHPILWILGSIALSLVIGYSPQVTVFRLTKAAVYFPFFIIGNVMSDQLFDWFKRHKRLLAIPAACIFGLYCWFVIYQKTPLLSMLGRASSTYKAMAKDYPTIDPLLQRAFFLVGVIILAFAFYVLIPRRRTFFTFIGENSMYVFVLHAIVLVIMRVFNYQHHYLESMTQLWMRLLFVLAAIIVTFLLASSPVKKVFKPILAPPFDLRKIVGKLYEQYQSRKKP